jgi:hypothetical protein
MKLRNSFNKGKKMIINLKKECKYQTITREEGNKINKLINRAWDRENKIIIDFGNILIASVSFIDEAFGKLAFEYSKNILKKKLGFKNMQDYDKALLNDILTSRYRQKDLDQNGASRLHNSD